MLVASFIQFTPVLLRNFWFHPDHSQYGSSIIMSWKPNILLQQCSLKYVWDRHGQVKSVILCSLGNSGATGLPLFMYTNKDRSLPCQLIVFYSIRSNLAIFPRFRNVHRFETFWYGVLLECYRLRHNSRKITDMNKVNLCSAGLLVCPSLCTLTKVAIFLVS